MSSVCVHSVPIMGLALTGVPPLGGVGAGIVDGQSWRASLIPRERWGPQTIPQPSYRKWEPDLYSWGQ